jgi:hypothetical protein
MFLTDLRYGSGDQVGAFEEISRDKKKSHASLPLSNHIQPIILESAV